MWSYASTVAPGMPSDVASDASQRVESRFGENHLITAHNSTPSSSASPLMASLTGVPRSPAPPHSRQRVPGQHKCNVQFT